MSKLFSIEGIIQLAIQVERNGKFFYDTLAREIDDASVKELFQQLAHAEENHVRTFEDIMEASGTEKEGILQTEDYYLGMNRLAGNYVFTEENKGAEMAAQIKDISQALELAIGFEDQSIEFYTTMKEGFPEDAQKAIEAIIEQEHMHKKLLTERKNSL
ncbi:MAG: ferritin family protein [Candidatus Ancaeobacter aquaticus]|nr:ferritin family protein [Candidatus Ancaeobacter aquaticus]